MIDTEKDNRKLVERAILIGFQDSNTPFEEATEHIEELEELVNGIEVPVVDRIIVKLREHNPKYIMGSGKAMEMYELVKELEADCIVFDCDVTPSQQRNWEKLTKVCVIDRPEVILDIFANRATTREAVVQVQLARMEYALPRLTRAWTHLSRQRGGSKGSRGDGEQQIEIDRRLVQARISALKRELKVVQRHRDTQRKSRDRSGIPHAAIVGYTNAGKSTLLNHLTGSDVLAEDKLFATLDPTTRQITLPNNQNMIITDTVGFVRKLPHNLVEAFKSTLEEATLADFLILLLDVSSCQVEQHWETTLAVLEELGAKDKQMIVAFNKVDKQHDPVLIARMRAQHPDCIFMSAVTGEGVDALQGQVMLHAKQASEIVDCSIPPSRHDIVSLLYKHTNILHSEYDDFGNMLATINVAETHRKIFEEFIT